MKFDTYFGIEWNTCEHVSGLLPLTQIGRTMRQVREVLRLTTAGVGLNEIARRVGVAASTVRLTLKRLASAGLSWPLPAEMTDSALENAAPFSSCFFQL